MKMNIKQEEDGAAAEDPAQLTAKTGTTTGTLEKVSNTCESKSSDCSDAADKDKDVNDAPNPSPSVKIEEEEDARDDDENMDSHDRANSDGDMSTTRGHNDAEKREEGGSSSADPNGTIPSSPKVELNMSSSVQPDVSLSSKVMTTPNSRKFKTSTAVAVQSPRPSPQLKQHYGYHPYHQHGRSGGGHGHPPYGMQRNGQPPSGVYPPHPHGPPPPHYYNGGHHDHGHYRGPPPPSHFHHHQMPPPMPPHPNNGPPPPGHYAPTGYHVGNHPNMSGRPGPPPHSHSHSHSGYGYPPHHPYQYGNNQYQPHHPNASSGPSDSSSIASSKSKRSVKSSSSTGSRKKRTIDGVNEGSKSGESTNATGHKEHAIPLSYSFRRTTEPGATGKNGYEKGNGDDVASTGADNNGDDTMQVDSPDKSSKQGQFHRSLPRMGSGSGTTSNIFEDPMTGAAHLTGHRRTHSSTSTASSLSVGGCSLESYDGPKVDATDAPMLKASPKRQKGNDSAPLAVNTARHHNVKSIFKRKGGTRVGNPSDHSIDGAESSRFGQLTMNDSESDNNKDDGANQSIFLALSTSPINQSGVDETPMKKNTNRKDRAAKMTIKTDMDEQALGKPSPSPLIPGSTSEFMTDEHTLNQHLRGQSFTPLPHGGDMGISPSNLAFKLAPSMSWSIAGDTPSLEDIAACSWEESVRSNEKKRPGSTTSQMSATRGLVISPHNFALFKDDNEAKQGEDDEHKDDGESIHLSVLSPHSDIAGMGIDGTGGATTPLPLFFREADSENQHEQKKASDIKSGTKESESMAGSSAYPRGPQYTGGHRFFPNYGHHRNDGPPPTPIFGGSKPPTPHGHGGYLHHSMSFSRSPMHGERRDFGMFGHHGGHGPNDRIRNLRGRMPPGVHMPPMPIHIPPPMSSHHPLTSPMGLPGGKPFWSPSHGMPSSIASPHHHQLMSPMDITQSKRKCIPMKPPIPSKFQGDFEKDQGATVPEFTSLVNFPAHMSQKQAVNLPEGMRCCVMCGQACPCSAGNKKKPGTNKKDTKSEEEKCGFAIIPTQNKGLCTLCDVNVWVVAANGLEIKWCKGCKNFRPWAAFGDKGLATKCLRCRDRQREKYALQKEEKEMARRSKSVLTVGPVKSS